MSTFKYLYIVSHLVAEGLGWNESNLLQDPL